MAIPVSDRAPQANVSRSDGLIVPDKIPGDDLNAAAVNEAASSLTSSATTIRLAASQVESGWNTLPAIFAAPGAEAVYRAFAPATESAEAFAEKLNKVSSALETFATNIVPLKSEFAAIKTEAIAFTNEIGQDGLVWVFPFETKAYESNSSAMVSFSGRDSYLNSGNDQSTVSSYLQGQGETTRLWGGGVQILASWTESSEHIDRNNRLLDRVANSYAKLSECEAECANAINRQRDDCVVEVVAVEAWQLKQSGENTADLPWGHRVDEDRNCGESFWWGAGNAGKDMLTGVGSLVSYNPVTGEWGDWGNAGAAWVATASGIGSLVLSTMPMTPALAAAGVPVFVAAQTNTQNMLKGLVAWDTWAENPAEAFGATLVNVGTMIIPGAGAVGGIVKVITVGTKLEAIASAIVKVEQVSARVDGLLGDSLAHLLRPGGVDSRVDVPGRVDLDVDIDVDVHGAPGSGVVPGSAHAGGHGPDVFTREEHTPGVSAADAHAHTSGLAGPSTHGASGSDNSIESNSHDTDGSDRIEATDRYSDDARADGSTNVGVGDVAEPDLGPLSRSEVAQFQSSDYSVAIFGSSTKHYYDVATPHLGAPGRPFFVMPGADAAIINNASDAARYTGMAPSAQAAHLNGGDVYALAFPAAGIPHRLPTAVDAQEWPHFLEGGHTAVRMEGASGGFLVNPTREFVIPGGTPVPPGSILVRIVDGNWIVLRRNL